MNSFLTPRAGPAGNQTTSPTLQCALCNTSCTRGKPVYRGFDFTFCSSQCRNLVALSDRDPQQAIRNLMTRPPEVPFFPCSRPGHVVRHESGHESP